MSTSLLVPKPHLYQQFQHGKLWLQPTVVGECQSKREVTSRLYCQIVLFQVQLIDLSLESEVAVSS